jgi:hypothetical protein
MHPVPSACYSSGAMDPAKPKSLSFFGEGKRWEE